MTDYACDLGRAARRLTRSEDTNPFADGCADFHMWRIGFLSEGGVIKCHQAAEDLRQCADTLTRIGREIERRKAG